MKLIWLMLMILSSGQCFERCIKIDRFCNCDDACSEFGDCCPSHQNYGKYGVLRNISQCKPLTRFPLMKMWVINKCKNRNHRLVEFCSKKQKNPNVPLKSFIPVIADNGFIYENSFCAQCNNERQFKFLNISFECMMNNISDLYTANEMIKKYPLVCEIEAFIDLKDQRTCEDHLTRLCPTNFTEKTIKTKCETGKENIVTNGLTFYRNMACCKCWNESCFYSLDDFPFRPYKFSYILNFNEWEDDHLEVRLLDDNSTSSINITEVTLMNNIVFYSSFTFSCLSIFSLVLLIILYATHRMFHNFGGYLTICLSICILLMHLITLLVGNNRIVQSSFCKYFAIIQYFICLSTFVLMAIYALDLLQTFGLKSQVMSKKKGVKTFFVYCTIGFGCSATLVSISTVMEYTVDVNSSIKPRYGGSHCWFTNKVAGIIWYFVPVCLLLFWNFGTCVAVFYRLATTAKDCRVIQKKDSNSTLWLCIRLTAVFGIGYVFQIVAVLSHVNVLIIIGSVVNCLQGFLLMVCFVFTRRVQTLVTKTLTSLTDNISKSTSTSKSMQKQTTKTTYDSQMSNSKEKLKI